MERGDAVEPSGPRRGNDARTEGLGPLVEMDDRLGGILVPQQFVYFARGSDVPHALQGCSEGVVGGPDPREIEAAYVNVGMMQQHADRPDRADEDDFDAAFGKPPCAGDRHLGRATGHLAEVADDDDAKRPIHIGFGRC